MSETDETFRVQARFNKVEFADLEEDLSRFEGAARAGRIRLLMRLGLATAKGQVPHHPHHDQSSHLAKVVDIPRGAHRQTDAAHPAPASATPAVPAGKPVPQVIACTDSIENLEGLDPLMFKLGQAS